MKRTLIVVVVALSALALPAVPGHAYLAGQPGVLTGLGEVTAYANCPEQFKIPITASSADGATWTFAIAGAHASCVITWGNPLVFRGAWNAQSPVCDPNTGAGCPITVDPVLGRVGFLALGAVPRAGSATVTSLRFCVNGRCWQGSATVERGPVPALPEPAAVNGSLFLSPPGCDPYSMVAPVHGATDGGGTWVFTRDAAVAVACGAPVYGIATSFVGAWDPDTGGCISGLSHASHTLCLGGVPNSPAPAHATLQYCYDYSRNCWNGVALLSRT